MYKVTKKRLQVEQFHGRGERMVKQEVYASCTLIALTRLFTNRCEEGFRSAPGEHGKPRIRANVKNGLAVVAEHLEGLLMQQEETLGRTVRSIVNYMGAVARECVRAARTSAGPANPSAGGTPARARRAARTAKMRTEAREPGSRHRSPPCLLNELVSGPKRMPSTQSPNPHAPERASCAAPKAVRLTTRFRPGCRTSNRQPGALGTVANHVLHRTGTALTPLGTWSVVLLFFVWFAR